MYKNHIKPICDKFAVDGTHETVTSALSFQFRSRISKAANMKANAILNNIPTTEIEDEIFQYRTMLILLGESEADIDNLIRIATNEAMSNYKQGGDNV